MNDWMLGIKQWTHRSDLGGYAPNKFVQTSKLHVAGQLRISDSDEGNYTVCGLLRVTVHVHTVVIVFW